MRTFQENFALEKEAAMPKKKFAFVRKARKAPIAAPTQAAASAVESSSAATDLLNSGNHLSIKDLSG